MDAIREFYEWAEGCITPFRPEERLRSGPIMSAQEIGSFAAYVRAGGRHAVVAICDAPKHQLSATGIRSTFDTNKRLRATRNFIYWASETQLSPRPEREALDRLARQFESHQMREPIARDKWGLGEPVVEQVLRVCHPDAEANPFNRPCRVRNWVVFRVLLETGIRCGELCNMRLDDLFGRGADQPFVRVVKRDDEIADPRRNQPRVKTRGRRIPIGRDLFRDCQTYIAKHRGMHRHPYLWIGRRGGAPLNVSAVEKMFSRLKTAALHGQEVDFTPHSLRRTFNDRVWAACRAKNINQQQTKAIQNYLAGWSEKSKQAENYSRLAIEQEAMEVASQMHRTNSEIAALAQRPS